MQTEMSGFSAELIDYLEGRITFEEFDRRREEREAAQPSVKSLGEDGEEEDVQPSTSAQGLGTAVDEGVSPVVQQAFASMLEEKTPSTDDDDDEEQEEEEEEEEEEDEDTLSYVDDTNDADFSIDVKKVLEKEESARGRGGGGRRKRKKKMKKEDGGGGGGDGGDGGGGDGRESPSVGDIFALEMELNRENSKMMRERRHRSKLPRALRGLMGEANIRYARGEKDDAIVMCMEIIRQAPLAYEPFSTLAMIYEDDGDVDKALQFGLIAAHLNPSDCEEWVKLADMSLDRDNVRQAIICYSKAVKYDPTNVRYLWERSGLYMRLGEHKQCMDGYRRILSLLPREEGEHFMTLSKDMAKSYFESDDLPSALGVTEEALLRHPELVTDDMINMAAELYLAGHQHSKALQVLVKFSGIVLVRKAPDKTADQIPDQIPDKISDQIPDKTSDQIPDKTSDQTPDKIPDKTSDQTPDKTSDQISDKTSDQILDKTSDQISDKTSDQISDKTSDQNPDKTSDQILDKTSDQISDKTSDQILDKTSDQISDKTSDQISDKTSDQISDKTSDQISDKTSTQTSNQISDSVTKLEPNQREKEGETERTETGGNGMEGVEGGERGKAGEGEKGQEKEGGKVGEGEKEGEKEGGKVGEGEKEGEKEGGKVGEGGQDKEGLKDGEQPMVVEEKGEEAAGKVEELGEIVEVEVPDSVPVDIRAKLMVCLIHQHVYTPLDGLLTEMMGQSPEEVGDLHLDVAEAFLEEGEFSSALQLLSALVTSVKYNLAVVWLRHAECLKALGHLEAAAESYDRVVEMAPQHLGARLSLSTLQQQLGRPESALKALEPMYDADTLAQDSSATQKELKLLLHRSTLLKTQGHLQDYIDAVITMISLLLKVAMTRSCVCVRSVMVAGKRHRRLVKVKDMTTDDVTDQEAAYQDISGKTSVLSREEWWQLLVDCVHTMCEVGRYLEAELMVDSAMEFYSFYENKPKRKQLEFFGLSAAFLDHNYRKAYDYIRIMLMDTSDAERPQLWNVFNQVTLNSQHQRHHRFCLRLMLKNPDNHALCVLCGHNAMVSGSFKHALGQYMQAFRTHGSNPMYSLCVGLTFFHLAAQKFVSKRHPLVLQGFSFLWRYVELRGECQESLYNLGRALHQMGLVHLAIHYYHQALTLPPPALEGIAADQVDLRREIAFNLSLIYQASGNTHLARQTLYTHCVI